ncbi:pre-mRNA-splicing factor CWC22 homolog [Euwallacea similis]|uniref:pre-mRNA-splicing factor CWC22 homolog n=1 Tax=Euwallacea similis TaxID=1736056 RepID=UPI00344DA13F
MSPPNNEVANSSSNSKRKSNTSLSEKDIPLDPLPSVSKRNTITESSVTKARKKGKLPLAPTIPEDDTAVQKTEKTIAFSVKNETKKLNRKSSDASRISTTSSSSKSKLSRTYDNKAFEGNLKRSGSTTNSVTTTSRPPSLQSSNLEIYHEQYCCFAKRTKCERSLLIAVTVLAIIIVALVVVIIVLAKNNKLDNLINF